MKIRTVFSGVIAVCLLSTAALQAQELRYWGKTPGSTKGWIELGPGQYYEVAEGDAIPGWGRVQELGDYSLVVEQVLTEAEKERLRSQGVMAHDVLEIQIPHMGLSFPQR